MTYRIQPLGEHSLTQFTCGNADLDEWLWSHARTATGHGTRIYLMVEGDRRVVGYFAVAPHLLSRGEAPSNFGRGAPEHIPAVLLAKFALDSSEQGTGLGSELLVEALEIIVTAARHVGGRLLIVDAIDDAARSFYEHHDFVALPGGSRRLFMKLSSAARALGMPWS